jgi:hypothetical protein
MEEMREVIRIAPERPEGHLFLARGLLPDPARIDEVEALAREGLRVARAPDVQALGWLLLADVFARRGETAKVNEALRRAEVLAPRRSESSNDEARHD